MNTHSLRFRIAAWYATLLAGALLFFSASVYIGLNHYLQASLQRFLKEQARSIGQEFLPSLPQKGNAWLKQEIDEDYAPDVNGRFIRVTRSDGNVVYLSDPPKDGSFDSRAVPAKLPASGQDHLAKVELAPRHQFLVEQMSFTSAGSTYTVEIGAPDQQIEDVLHGLVLTLSAYMPVIIFLAIAGGYWLMRRALKPVDDITKRAEGITSTNLSERLPVIQTGDELERLSISLNRMIERLDNAFQHINRFSADVSHELRTPLTILQLELESMMQHPRLSAALEDQIGSALEETQRLSRIVENLLTISRLDAGEGQIEKVTLDLGQLALSTVEQMHLLADEKSISLIASAEQEVSVEADRSRLKQVIVNLIDNALKYTAAGGKVTVAVSSEAGFAVLEVADNGIGIPAQALPHIFERFYRSDKARSRESGGAGLGLAIVKAICAAHSADVSVQSQEGSGSRFTVKLPVSAKGKVEEGTKKDLQEAGAPKP